MPKVAVVTDSCVSLPQDLRRRLEIRRVARYIHRGQDVPRDLVTIQRDGLYRWLPSAKELATTASPALGNTLQLCISLSRQEGIKQVVSLHVTASGSGAYQAAVAAQAPAQARYPDLEIEVIATPRVSLVHGWMVIEAAGAALRGERLEQMGARMREMIPITHVIHTADTLRYLHMGGRIGRAKRMVGSLLGVKPLIGMEDRVVVALGVARSRAQAHARMVEQAVGRCGQVKDACVHAAAREEAEKIKALVESRLTVVESLVAELSPAFGVHSGPGTAGLCCFPAEQAG